MISKLHLSKKKNDSFIIGKRQYLDKTKFSKIYTENIRIMFALCKSELNLFQYVIENMKPEVSEISNASLLNREKIINYLKISYATYDNVINVILRRNLIARSVYSNIYFVKSLIVCKIGEINDILRIDDLSPNREATRK